MEGLRSFALWIFLFGIIGSLCESQNNVINSDRKLSDGISTEGVVEKAEPLRQNDVRQPKATWKSRAARYVPDPDSNDHPTAEEMQRAREKAQRQIIQEALRFGREKEASARLAEEERDRERGKQEMAERIRNIQKRRNNNQSQGTSRPLGNIRNSSSRSKTIVTNMRKSLATRGRIL